MGKITISLPCFGRPLRTKRAIECLCSQTITGWEAFIMGDGCPHFQEMMDSGYLKRIKEEQALDGNTLHFFNNTHNMGGCGYTLTNHAIQNANGEYLVFFANDDIILPNHLENYLSIVEGTEYEMGYTKTWLDPWNTIRDPKLAPCEIGHSEIIVRTDVAKSLPPHSPAYGHDWDFINGFIQRGKCIKGHNPPTYHVMHIPNGGTKDVID